MTICDPACGTGGFLLAAHEWIAERPPPRPGREAAPALRGAPRLGDRRQHRAAVRDEPAAARHRRRRSSDSPIVVDDALKADPGERFEMVLTNPPFGRKSSMTIVNEEGEVEREDLVVVRDDFWASTSNKQLNFVQHIKTLLDDQRPRRRGRARQRALRGRRGRDRPPPLLQECDVHTLLRLPTGIFYAQGVKANVLFFDRKPAVRDAVDARAVGLRPAHEHALHAQAEPAPRTSTSRTSSTCVPARTTGASASSRSASSASPTTS